MARVSTPMHWRSRSTAARRTTRSRSRHGRRPPPLRQRTTTPTAISARCGLPNRGCTAASACGRWRSRAIASVVRETPRIRASSEPSAATAAPDADHRLQAGEARRGHRVGERSCRGSQGVTAQFGQHRDGDRRRTPPARSSARSGWRAGWCGPDRAPPRRGWRSVRSRRTRRTASRRPAARRPTEMSSPMPIRATSASPKPRMTTTTAASTARTTATMARVSSADF